MSQLHILVTGGAGYIGSVLVPKLLEKGYRVTVLDLLLFGDDTLAGVAVHPCLAVVRGDIRNTALVGDLLAGNRFDTIIHLAAISNDPSSELDPDLTRSINLEALDHIMHAAKQNGVSRFIYASSASVYGLKDTPDVTEDLSLEPITIYAKYKAEGEKILNSLVDDHFCGVSVRAATVCGYSPRLRLDLTINILSYHALTKGKIRVFGGSQMRPNIHIQDLTDFYVALVSIPANNINGKAFNVSRSNATVLELAEMIRKEINPDLNIEIVPTTDTRSYHLSTEKVQKELAFTTTRPLVLACQELRDAFSNGQVIDPDRPIYRNVELMKLKPITS